MGRVRAQQSMSLDGYAAGPATSDAHPLGIGGEQLHLWMAGTAEVNERVQEQTFAGAGAVVIGRTMLDVGLPIWDPPTFDLLPVFVPTHRPGTPVRVEGGSTFSLVSDEVDTDRDTVRTAVDRARAAAGERDVVILGGPTTVRGAIELDLVDELRLQVVHTFLGAGERLFVAAAPQLAGFVVAESATAPGVTHLTLVRG